jgi:hypothetical protein
MWRGPGLPYFSGNIIPIYHKLGIPNGHNTYIATFYIPRWSKIFPTWDFWYENTPSGNPGGLIIERSYQTCNRVAIFFFVQYTKWGEIYQSSIYYTKFPLNIPNWYNIYQHNPSQGPPKIYPNWNFWHENKPSGYTAMYGPFYLKSVLSIFLPIFYLKSVLLSFYLIFLPKIRTFNLFT